MTACQTWPDRHESFLCTLFTKPQTLQLGISVWQHFKKKKRVTFNANANIEVEGCTGSMDAFKNKKTV